MVKDFEQNKSPGGNDNALSKLRQRLKEKEKALEVRFSFDEIFSPPRRPLHSNILLFTATASTRREVCFHRGERQRDTPAAAVPSRAGAGPRSAQQPALSQRGNHQRKPFNLVLSFEEYQNLLQLLVSN